MKKEKGITLIALVITIIVLLILAGISIATLTGENGLLSKAKIAKTRTEKTEIEEQIKLAVMTARMNQEETNINLEVLEKELTQSYGITGIEKQGENGNLPWKITHKGYIFQITEEGNVIEISGIFLNKTTLKLEIGETEKIIATKTEGTEGNITWASSASNVTVNNDGNVTIEEGASGIATITAKVEGTDYSATCEVIVLSKVSAIKVDNFSVEKNKTKSIIVKTEPTENIEKLTYTYTTTSANVTINNGKGEVTGTAVGTATITVTGTRRDGTTLTATFTVTIEKAKVALTAEQIAATPNSYYGRKVFDYNTSDTSHTYRIFHVDKAGKYGPANTIYLKADYSGSYSLTIPTEVPANTKTIVMNQLWAKNRIGTGVKTITQAKWNTLNDNEKAAAWLCDPTTADSSSNQTWKGWFDANKAEYVIGGPGIEMYIDSYNTVSHSQGNKKLEYGWKNVNNYPGYGYPTEYVNDIGSVDYTDYGSMYAGKDGIKGSGEWWLASSVNGYLNINVGMVDSPYSRLIYGRAGKDNSQSHSLSPLIALKLGETVLIEE